ncbi:hypothetical protein GGR52DRAFT_545422 [Hypoxylon sp. FL1284]|nr:hypothetical protein GGR52DRAFT_545422 [Hypoxylon sp. FL1284]
MERPGEELAREGNALLGSDFMKDLTIKCKDQTWKVHKLIVAARMEWFKAALCESEDDDKKEIVLRGPKPVAVDLVIQWIYTRRLGPEFDSDDKLFEASIWLHEGAVFFGDARLMTIVEEKLSEKLDNFADNLADNVEWYAVSEGLGQSYLSDRDATRRAFEGYFRGVTLAYGLKRDWAKELFIRYAPNNQWLIMYNKHFREMANDVCPDYLRDLSVRFVEHVTNPSENEQTPNIWDILPGLPEWYDA